MCLQAAACVQSLDTTLCSGLDQLVYKVPVHLYTCTPVHLYTSILDNINFLVHLYFILNTSGAVSEDSQPGPVQQHQGGGRVSPQPGHHLPG